MITSLHFIDTQPHDFVGKFSQYLLLYELIKYVLVKYVLIKYSHTSMACSINR